MVSREIVDLLLTSFKSLYLIEKNDVDFTEEYVRNKVNDILSITNIEISKQEFDQLLRNIFSEFLVHQDDGIALLNDYEHEEWYFPEKVEKQYFWERYRRLLRETTDIDIDALEKKVLNQVVSYLGNPLYEGSFRRNGLVIGDVQSGKTASYIGLICKAVDAGYKLIILLSGTMENLRMQTQERVESGFIGFDTFKRELVGVGTYANNEITPFSLTSTDNDFTGSMDRTTVLQNLENGIPIIFVIKKNSKVLSKLYEGLKSSRKSSKVTAPMIMIDDEADNASINTSKNDSPTKINESIRKILNICEKCNYVGFTATPFANVFIDPDSQEEMLGSDLFPNDFIYAMFPPSSYIGAKKYFIEKNETNVRIITDDMPEFFSHTKDWHGDFPFQSFYDSIITFFLANVIRDIKNDNKKHRTMLINVSRFTNVHYQIQKSVNMFLNLLKDSITLNINKPYSEYIQNPVIQRIFTVWEIQYKSIMPWNVIACNIENSTKNIYTVVVNSTSKNKLKYGKDKEERVIAIGGIALSRGLTLEGLVVSYFYRNTCTFDVLMQMGRWFGYRNGYEDLCRVFIPKKSEIWYKEIAESIENLKSDMAKMAERKLTPKQFGIRVRNDSDELGITARSKMRNTMKRDRSWDFYGSVFEAPYIISDTEINKNHILAVKELSKSLKYRDESQLHPYFRNIKSNLITKLLDSLTISRLNTHFDVFQISNFIENSKLSFFDVLFMEGDSSTEYLLTNDLKIRLLERTFDVKKDKIETQFDIIRSNGQRTRIGGPTDTKYGLSKEQINEIILSENLVDSSMNRNTRYMIPNRNPLLIIYLLELKTQSCTAHELIEANKFNNSEYPLVGFAMGIPNFPHNEGYNTINREGHKYVVPYKYDYFSLYGKEEENEIENSRDVEE